MSLKIHLLAAYREARLKGKYADPHKGCCLVIFSDTAQIVDENIRVCSKVAYPDEIMGSIHRLNFRLDCIFCLESKWRYYMSDQDIAQNRTFQHRIVSLRHRTSNRDLQLFRRIGLSPVIRSQEIFYTSGLQHFAPS